MGSAFSHIPTIYVKLLSACWNSISYHISFWHTLSVLQDIWDLEVISKAVSSYQIGRQQLFLLGLSNRLTCIALSTQTASILIYTVHANWAPVHVKPYKPMSFKTREDSSIMTGIRAQPPLIGCRMQQRQLVGQTDYLAYSGNWSWTEMFCLSLVRTVFLPAKFY